MAHAIRPLSAALIVTAAMLALAACAPTPPRFPELPRLEVSTGFGLKNLCGLGVSPPISISGAPQGTARYRVKMTNTSVLVQDAWEDTLPATPAGVAEGAAASYPPPCMGTFQQYAYRFEIMALDAGNRPLAYGQTTASAVSLDRIVRQQRRTPATQTPAAASTTAPPAIIDKEDDSDLFGTLPYRNYGPIVAPPPVEPTD